MMIFHQVWVLLLVYYLSIATATFDLGDPQKYLLCFFQELKVFKCEDEAIKEAVKIYYTEETGERIDINNNESKCPESNKPIKIITHGWGGSANNSWFTDMNELYKKEDIQNVYAVDWSEYARNPIYFQSAADAKCVGDALGEFIVNHLIKSCKANLKDLHLIGHSLGAHISGFAGKYVQENINSARYKRIHRITGLDPAGPYFWKCDPQYRLDKEDADIVDVIHTDEFKFGTSEPLGHFDFYVNGGHAPQPGCFIMRKKRGTSPGVTCSHSRSSALFSESIASDGFIAKQCGNEFLYNLGQCNDNIALIMGEYLNDTLEANGNYQIQTNGRSPFAKFGQISLISI